MKKTHTTRTSYRRLLWLTLLCCSLLIALILRQQEARQAQLSKLQADQEKITIQAALRQMDIFLDKGIPASRRTSYSEAMGKQHEHQLNEETRKGNLSKEGQAKQANLHSDAENTQAVNGQPLISVRLSETNEIEQVSLEQYVLGVALAELPKNFEKEAIKAQMLAARTYITRRLLQHQEKQKQSTYEVSDTTADQVYMSLEQVEQYKQNYPQEYEKFIAALQETEGQIISYQDEPIDAVFFSTSNGFTEDAEQLWGEPVPYLQRVASPWDVQVSPNFETTYEFTFSDLYDKLNLKQSRRTGKLQISNVVRNASGRVNQLKVNGASFTGRELREKLGLASTAFEWKIDEKNESVSIICYGYGHGIGLSQWGANGMAMEGYEADDIIKHYYQGVEIDKLQSL